MRNEYMYYNGKFIQTGRVFKTHPHKALDKSWEVEEVTFLWHDPEIKRYGLWYSGKILIIGQDYFDNLIIEPVHKMDDDYLSCKAQKEKDMELTFDKEMHISGMIVAWAWYLMLMGVSFIFVGFYFYWIVISTAFFTYRQAKLKKEGYRK